MGCDCKKTYNIGMGCCQPVLAPADNFYTKYQTDMRIEEAISGITVSGITEEQAEEMIEEATSGKADSSDVYTKQESDALLANKQDELTAGTGIDITNNVISVTGGIITSGDVIDVVSGYTYDKATIDEKVASGGTFDPTQYYNKTATDELLAEKLDASAYTPTDLSNYYNKQEVDNKIASAKTEIEGEIPSLSGYATEQWVEDKHYITGVDLSNYSTTEQMNGAISAATSGLQPTLSAGTGIDITDNVISATGGGSTYTAGRAIDIDSGNTISFGLPISAGTGTNALIYNHTGNTASGNFSHAEGQKTQANGIYSHAEGYMTKAEVNTSHAEGVGTQANGSSSHAEGWGAVASGQSSHAEGFETKANGYSSHSEGYNTQANGSTSHAEGSGTKSDGNYSHAEGVGTQANGSSSHAEGSYTVANNESEHASGRYNVSNTGSTDADKTLFSVGNGTSNTRHNAFELRRNGDIYIQSGSTDIKLQDYIVKVWKGTKAEFDAITVKDNDTIYLVTN